MLRTRAKNEAHERKLKKEEIEKLNEELDILGKAAIEWCFKFSKGHTMLSKILLIFAVAIGFGATGCTQAYINKIVRKSVTKYRHQIQQVESDKSILEQVSFTHQAEAAVTATTEINSHDLRSFSERHIGELLALLSLFTIWLACPLYSPRAQIRTEPLDPEGLAMIRILKDTALDLWGKYNARPKVIDLECLAEREVGPI